MNKQALGRLMQGATINQVVSGAHYQAKIFDYGNTVPTDASKGYATACLFLHTDGGEGTAFYVNEGTAESCDFNVIEGLTAAQSQLIDNLVADEAELQSTVDQLTERTTVTDTITLDEDDNYISVDGSDNVFAVTLDPSPTDGQRVTIGCVNNDNAVAVGGIIDGQPDTIVLSVGDIFTFVYNEDEGSWEYMAKWTGVLWLRDAVYEDLRISADQVTEQGSNPPKHAKYKDNGELVAGGAGALSFLSNSQGYINIPADSTIDFRANDCSVELWFKPTLDTNNNTRIVSPGSFALAFMSDLNRLRFYTVQIGNQYSLTNTVNINEWNHIVVTYKEGGPPYQFTVYCNGVQLMQYSQNSLPSASSSLDIVDEKFINFVDYIALWGKTLTEEEVVAQYNNGLGTTLIGDESFLTGLWKLNDGSGTTLDDATSNANDGSIVGGTEGTQWDWVDGHVGATVPGSHGVHLPFFLPDVEEEVFFSVQLPHAWKEGTDIRPHIHWVCPNAGGTDEQPRWGLEYLWKNIGQVYGDTTIIYGEGNHLDENVVADKHYLTETLSHISGTGQTISSMMVCRLFRDGTDGDDSLPHPIGFLEIDFHYEVNTLGSTQEYVK